MPIVDGASRRPRREVVTQWWEVLVVAALALGVFAVHDVGYALRHPFWLDEAWVAASVRAPVGQVLQFVHAAAPVGFSVALRFEPFGFEQGLRMLPLLFAAGAVVAGYLLGKELRLHGVLGGVLVGGTVLFLPAMLVRNDLKQYTAEAFFALLLVYLLARLESSWSRHRLAAITLASAIGMLFANAMPFTALAVFGSLAVVATSQRRWDRLREIAVAGSVAAAAMVAIYIATLSTVRGDDVVAYWEPFYLPTDHGISGAWGFVRARGVALAPSLGTSNVALIIGMVLVGLATLVWLKRTALALCVPLLIVGVATASALRLYPFLDLRTSTFWLVLLAALMAVGFAGIVTALARHQRLVALAVLVAGVATYVYAASPQFRAHTIPDEDVRAQVRYVERHRKPDDVVLVSYPATFGTAYYAKEWEPVFRRGPGTLYEVTFPGREHVIAVQGREQHNIDRSFLRARREAESTGASAIWIIRSHVSSAEELAWQEALGARVGIVNVGPEPLVIYRPGPP